MATKLKHYSTLGTNDKDAAENFYNELLSLINAIKLDPEWNNQEARKKLLSFISSHGLASEEARKARRQLSSILFN